VNSGVEISGIRPPVFGTGVVALLVICLWTAAAQAQGAPTLNDLVAQWSSGSFRSPLMCELDGELTRGVRRVLILSRPMPGRPPVTTVEFVDIDPGPATRCMDATGKAMPNIVGKLELRRSGHRHPETAKRDFKRSLKQNKGFTYQISGGVLSIQAVAPLAPEPRLVNFRGGTLTLSLIFPSTDPARALSDFRSVRKLLLTAESPEGDRVILPLFDPSAVKR
jgi:hypothetical protein